MPTVHPREIKASIKFSGKSQRRIIRETSHFFLIREVPLIVTGVNDGMLRHKVGAAVVALRRRAGLRDMSGVRLLLGNAACRPLALVTCLVSLIYLEA